MPNRYINKQFIRLFECYMSLAIRNLIFQGLKTFKKISYRLPKIYQQRGKAKRKGNSITGHVIDHKTGSGIGALRVEAWDRY